MSVPSANLMLSLSTPNHRSTPWYEPLEVPPRILDIEQRCGCVHPRPAYNDHNVGVGCEGVNEGRESGVADLHPLELGLSLPT
mmetsp:Transcript_19940/g.40386  ORF Transcript_19940/g.40386 Transcript_19940/m.40386 type:complete len:83 (-) Transcript_19940:101-349(-)